MENPASMKERLDPGPFFCPVRGRGLRWTGRRHTQRTRDEIAAGIPVHVIHRQRLLAAIFDCPIGVAEHRLDARLPQGHPPRTRHLGGEVSWQREHIALRRTEFLPPSHAERTPWRFAVRTPGAAAEAAPSPALPVSTLSP